MLATRVPSARSVVLPLVVAILAVFMSSQKNFDNDVRAAWHFRGPNANATLVADNRGGPERTALAVLDLVSHDGDPLLVWTNDPFPYLNLNRVSATRFFYKRFLLGEIYLGRTSTAYVLPDTWKWFAEDLRQSRIRSRTCSSNEPNLPSGNPFADYVKRNFDLVFPDKDLPVSLRNDVARQVLRAAGDRRIGRAGRPTVSPTGWTVDGNDARYEQGPADELRRSAHAVDPTRASGSTA